MGKHGDLEKRITSAVSLFFPIMKDSKQEDDKEFSLLIKPFDSDICYFAIEKIKTVNIVNIRCVILTTKNIQDKWKKISEDEKLFILIQFRKIHHRYKRDLKFGNDFSSVQNSKFLITQNISMQNLLDMLFENILLVKDMIPLLIEMDNEIKSLEIDNNNMFQ